MTRFPTLGRAALVVALLFAPGGCAIVKLPVKAAGVVVGTTVDIVTRAEPLPR